MKTQVTTFNTPEVTVLVSNIVIDLKAKRFTLDLGTKGPRKRKFDLKKIEGTLTQELYAYLTRMTPVKVPVKNEEVEGGIEWINTGRKATGFQKFLAIQGIEFKPGILKEMKFECANTSDNFYDNPFRLVCLEDRNILTLVNVPSKKVTTVLNADGSTSKFYKNKTGVINGRRVKAFIMPEKYRRLVIKETKEVEVAQVEGFNPFILKQ